MAYLPLLNTLLLYYKLLLLRSYMDWYELDKGPLMALKSLLDSPLSFDSVDYIDRTFIKNNKSIDKDIEKLAQFYDETRKNLFSKISSVSMMLSCCSKLKPENYDKSTVPFTHELLVNEVILEESSAAIVIRNCDSINIQIDRLKKSFNIRNHSIEHYNRSLSEFISFYMLSEILFLSLAGMTTVKFDLQGIQIKPKSKEIVKQLHRKWFANYLEQSGSLATISVFAHLKGGDDRNPHFKELIHMIGAGFRDKIFSIPARELPNKLSYLESVQWIDKVCNTVALCIWCQTKKDMMFAPNNILQKIGIQDSDINTLSKLMNNYSEPDKIFSISEEGIRLNNLDMTTQIRAVINDLANEISDKKLNQIIGNFFEKEYIANFFSDNDLEKNYKVHEGVLAHEVRDELLKPDVDLILEDIRRNEFYFIQVKYLRIGSKAHISGDLDHIVSGKLLKGVKQLSDAKDALQTGKMKDLLNERGINNCNEENSTFLLIHNISNFDYCIWPSGIVSYDWNSIRNLFKDGEISIINNDSISKNRQPTCTALNYMKPLPIGNPDEIIRIFMEEGPLHDFSSISTLFDADNLCVNIEINNTTINCQGMGL